MYLIPTPSNYKGMIKQNKKTHKQIKKKQNKTSQKQKQNKNNYTHCDFPGNSKWENIYCNFFPCNFFLPTQHILTILH
jgi:hypothetical protein